MKKYKIGMRNIKTAISVFIATMIYVLLLLIDQLLGNDTESWNCVSQWYTPFFAGIAAAYASIRDFKSSLKQAKIRSVGSIIGGYFAMILIMIVEYIFLDLIGFQSVDITYKIISFFIVSLGIILVIWLTVITKQTDATFITCLTYLSVTISIRNGGMPIAQFATNRILSTLVGVGVALLVNLYRPFRKHNLDILFVANMDDINTDNVFRVGYTNYKLNQLYRSDIRLTLHTREETINPELFNNVIIEKPIIVMDGACIYDGKTSKIIDAVYFEDSLCLKINDLLRNKFSNYFAYSVQDYKLYAYYHKIDNIAATTFIDGERRMNNYHLINAEICDLNSICMYVIAISNDDFELLKSELNNLNLLDMLLIKEVNIPKEYIIEGYHIVKLLPKNSTRIDTIKKIDYFNEVGTKIVFTNTINDLELIKEADFVISYSDASDEVKNHSDYLIKGNDFNDVLRLFYKLSKDRNPHKTMNRLREKTKKKHL